MKRLKLLMSLKSLMLVTFALTVATMAAGNVDSRTKEESHQLFLNLRKQLGQTVVIVTHDAGLAQMCDRSCYLVDGSFV